MKRMIDPLLTVDSPSHLVRVLQSWRLWLVGAIIGGLLGWGIYALFFPPYRAQASVVVDYNVEDYWISKLNTQYSFFYQRETRKLKEIAYSDEAMGMLVEMVDDVTIQELRSGKLLLSYPYGGAWHFWAEDPDPAKAEELASVWAEIFYDLVLEKVEITPEIDALRIELNTFVDENPQVDTGHPEVVRLMGEIAFQAEKIKGVSPYIDISKSQIESLPVSQTVEPSMYIFVGSFVGVALIAFLVLFTSKSNQED